LSQKKFIVTGGCGFIGSHLVDALLSQGHRVAVIDNLSTGRQSNLESQQKNPSLTVEVADLAQPGSWAKIFEKADAVFHLAALADIVPSLERPLEYFRANVTGTSNVLEAMRATGVSRIIYAASSSCYGIPDTFPTSETAPIKPEYPYALTKNLGEQLVMHWNKVYRLQALSLRFFNVYGRRSRTGGTYGAVFGVFLRQKLAGKPLTVVGNGQQTRDFTHVSDVVQALITAQESELSGEIMNVGSGRTVSVNRLVELIGGPTEYLPKRPGEPDCTFADISKIRRLLKWEPRMAFEDGVKDLLNGIEQWKDAPLWTSASIAEATKEWFHYLGER
jgi:UDP-glucose 4-epimerase